MVVMPVGMKVRGGGLILVEQVFNVSMLGELGMGFVVVFLKLRTLHAIQFSKVTQVAWTLFNVLFWVFSNQTTPTLVLHSVHDIKQAWYYGIWASSCCWDCRLKLDCRATWISLPNPCYLWSMEIQFAFAVLLGVSWLLLFARAPLVLFRQAHKICLSLPKRIYSSEIWIQPSRCTVPIN